MKNQFNYFKAFLFSTLSVLSMMLLSSCGGDSSEQDYSWMNVNLSAKTYETIDSNRLSDLQTDMQLASAGGFNVPKILQAPEGYVASGIAFLDKNLCLVSYHSAVGTEYKGALELLSCNENGFVKLKDGLRFDARINNVTTDGKNRVFIGLDTKNGPLLATLSLTNSAFFKDPSIHAIRLNGVSVNGLLYAEEDGVEYIYSATGGNGTLNSNNTDSVYFFNGSKPMSAAELLSKPGFQKMKIEGTTLTPIAFQGNGNNRGKWLAKDGTAIVSMHFSSYNNYSTASIQYYPNFVKQFHKRAVDQRDGIATYMEILEAKNMCCLESYASQPDYQYLYVCAGDKGFKSFRLDRTKISTDENAEKPRFTLLDEFELSTFAVASEEGKMYLACGEKGVQVLNNQEGMFSPYKYFKVKLEDGTASPSANFVLTSPKAVFIAYGAHGVVSISKDNELFLNGSAN